MNEMKDSTVKSGRMIRQAIQESVHVSDHTRPSKSDISSVDIYVTGLHHFCLRLQFE